MLKRHRTLAIAGAIATSALLALTGCSQDSGSAAADGGLTQLSVAVSPSAGTAAPIYYGVENGIYRKHGLEVELSQATDGSVVVPQVLNGQLQFAMTSFESHLNAVVQGLPIRMISAGNLQQGGGSQYSGVIVAADDQAPDLAGAGVFAVQDASRTPEMELVVDRLNGDYDAMELLQVPFGSIADSVASGAAGAGFLVQPFLDQALARGDVRLLTYVDESMAISGAPGAIFIANAQYLADNADVARAFVAASQEALTYAAADRAEISAFTQSSGLADTAIPPNSLPPYPDQPVELAQVQRLVDLYVEYGYIPSEPAPDQLTWQDGGGFR
jgi:NitT/TauT family transport system substrate-binding protein